MKKVSKITLVGVFVAFSFILSFVKLPSPFGSVALDSFPGFFLATVSPLLGGVVALLGHFFTSWNSGFPFGIYHIFIAIEMLLITWFFGKLYFKNKITAIIVGVILNGILSPLTVIPLIGTKAVISFIPFLTFASFINIILAFITKLGVQKYPKVGELYEKN